MIMPINSSGQIIKKMHFARNDLRVLAAIRDCGFIRARQLMELLPYRGLRKIGLTKTYGYANRLAHMGLVVNNSIINAGLYDANKFNPRKYIGVYSVTNEGHTMLRVCNCGLEIPANPFNVGEASINHFVLLTDIMLKFYRELTVKYWLTDFIVRSENQLRQEQGFAKDYDAVCEVKVGSTWLTVAIEYEHTLKNRAKYTELFKSYSSDPYVQLVVFVVDSPRWIAPFTESITVTGTRLCFVTIEDFQSKPFNSMPIVRWKGNILEQSVLEDALQVAAKSKHTEFMVSHTNPI
jgi:hypothetical protein